MEPMQSMQSQQPSIGQQPTQFHSPSAPPMTPHQAVAPPKVYPEESKNVPVPQQQAPPTTTPDVSDVFELSDWLYIGVGVLLIELFFLFLIRYYPEIFGKYINVWYNRFKLSAVIADVGIILLGFAIARYVYSHYIYPNFDWNPAYFTLTTVAIQVIHDVLFYFGVIKTVPPGENAMMDVFRGYAEEKGGKIILADSSMMVGSSLLSMAMKSLAPHTVVFIGLLAAYAVPYILETRNQFSGSA